MKRYYIIGFILLIAFLMFVAAGSAQPDSDVMIGTIGFFGIVALLPLFLYLVIAETRHIEEEIEGEALIQKEQEVPVVVLGHHEQQHIEAYGTRTPSLEEKTKRESALGIDSGFIDGIRAKQKDKSKGAQKEPEPKTGLLDIPDRVDKVPAGAAKSDERPDESSGSRVVDIPERVDEDSEPKEEIDAQLVSGLRADKTQTKDEEVKESEKYETPKESSKKDKSDDSHEEENKNKNEPEKEESG